MSLKGVLEGGLIKWTGPMCINADYTSRLKWFPKRSYCIMKIIGWIIMNICWCWALQNQCRKRAESAKIAIKCIIAYIMHI